jgi:hypothetical protein
MQPIKVKYITNKVINITYFHNYTNNYLLEVLSVMRLPKYRKIILRESDAIKVTAALVIW